MADALEGHKMLLGSKDVETLTVMHQLGTFKCYRAIYDTSEDLHRYMLSEREGQLGYEYPDTLRSICSLAYMFWDKGDYV